MTSSKIKKLSIVGKILCVLYVAWFTVSYAFRFTPADEPYAWLVWGSALIGEVLMTVLLVIPWYKYFNRMRKTEQYSPWLVEVNSGKGKFFCALYMLLNLALIVALPFLENTAMNIENIAFIASYFLAYLLYLIVSLCIFISHRRKRRIE